MLYDFRMAMSNNEENNGTLKTLGLQARIGSDSVGHWELVGVNLEGQA